MCENYFTKKEVQNILKISKFTLDNLISSKQIGHFFINSRVRISESHIDIFIEKNQMAAK